MLVTIWAIFAFISVVLAREQILASAFATLQYALHGIFLAAVVHLARSSSAAVDRRAWSISVLVIGGLVYAGLIILFALLIPDKATFPWSLRLPSGTNIRQLGYFVAIASVAPLSLILLGRTKTALFCLTFAALVTFIAWSGSRGALIGLLLGTVVGAAVMGNALSKLRVGLAVLSFFAGVAASIIVPNPAPEFGLIRMVSSLEQDDIGSGRSIVWKSTVTEISKSLWIGHGSGTFNKNMHEIYGFDFNHPHQFILQYFYDWGIFGGTAAGFLLLILFLACVKVGRQHNDAAAYASISTLCTIASVSMIDGALFYPLSIFLTGLAIACGFVNDSTQLERGPRTSC
nr:O-antigen ligase family protein [Sphingorhabdus profundilacus]